MILYIKFFYIINKKFINNDKNKKRYIMYRIYKYYFLVRWQSYVDLND